MSPGYAFTNVPNSVKCNAERVGYFPSCQRIESVLDEPCLLLGEFRSAVTLTAWAWCLAWRHVGGLNGHMKGITTRSIVASVRGPNVVAQPSGVVYFPRYLVRLEYPVSSVNQQADLTIAVMP